MSAGLWASHLTDLSYKTAKDAGPSRDTSIGTTAASSLLCEDDCEWLRLRGEDGALIFFDWDDTLLPSAHVLGNLKQEMELEQEVRQDSPSYELLRCHAEQVRKTLTRARNFGAVAIVTLAQRPWVSHSAKLFLPEIDFDDLLFDLGIQVYYAQEHASERCVQKATLEPGVLPGEFMKRKAMMQALRTHYGSLSREMHSICIGDSLYEIEAIKEVFWAADAGICKTVEFMSSPSIVDLTNELRLVTQWLQQIVACTSDFHIHLADLQTPEQVARLSAACLVDSLFNGVS